MAVQKVANISSLANNCVSTKKPNQTCGWGCRGKLNDGTCNLPQNWFTLYTET